MLVRQLTTFLLVVGTAVLLADVVDMANSDASDGQKLASHHRHLLETTNPATPPDHNATHGATGATNGTHTTGNHTTTGTHTGNTICASVEGHGSEHGKEGAAHGEGGEGGEGEEAAEEEEEAPAPMFFMFLSFALGAFFRRFLMSVPIPYTVLCFVFGLASAQLSRMVNSFREVSGATLAEMDPNLMLYLFLPILIFESAFGMNTFVFKMVFWQCLLLAGPGLLVASALTATFAKLVMYSEWTWIKVLLFGSLLSATDPVAVVALLKELGCDEKISTIIEGESLLNDGAAIVCFKILRKGLITNKVDTWWMIFLSFLRLALGGPIFGWFCGRLCVYVFKYTFNDPLVEVTITLSGAYLTYYIGDGLLGVSGVLCLVAFGVVLSARQSSISPEVMHFLHEFWGLAVYLANTLIFVLVGVQTRNAFDAGVEGSDVWKLVLLYLALNLIRFFVVFLFYPLINFRIFAFKVDWKNCLLVGWGGLRGAVGIALALNIQNHHELAVADPLMGGRVAFHVSGIVLLTILVNGITTGKLVKLLGLSEYTTDQLVNMRRVFKDLQRNQHKSIRVLQTDPLVADANWQKVKKATVGAIMDPYNTTPGSPDGKDSEKPTLSYNPEDLARRAAIRCFSNACWDQYQAGLLQDASVRRLSLFVERAKENDEYLDGEMFADEYLEPSKAGKLPCVSKQKLNQFIFHAYDSGAAWIHAHQTILEKIDTIAPNRRVQDIVRKRIQRNISIMQDRMRLLSVSAPGSANSIKTKFAARHVLNAGRNRVKAMSKDGVIAASDATVLIEQIEKAMNAVKKFPRSMPHPMPEAVLNDVHWFQVEAPEIQEKLMAFETMTLNEGYIKYDLDQPVDGACIIVQGMLQTETKEGHQFYLGPGQTVGIFSVLTGFPSSEQVIAKSFVKYKWCPKNELLKLTAESPTLAEELWRLVGTRKAAALLMADMPFCMWGLQKTFEMCEDGHLLHFAGDQNNQVVYLYPQNEYVLLHGTGFYSSGGSVTGPVWLRQGGSGPDNKNEKPERLARLKDAFIPHASGRGSVNNYGAPTGRLNERGLRLALNQLGLQVSQAEVSRVFAEDDKDRSGSIDWEEFKAICSRESVSFSADAKVLSIPRYREEERPDDDEEEDDAMMALSQHGSSSFGGRKSPGGGSGRSTPAPFVETDIYGDAKNLGVNRYGSPLKSSYYVGNDTPAGSFEANQIARFNGTPTHRSSSNPNPLHQSPPPHAYSNGHSPSNNSQYSPTQTQMNGQMNGHTYMNGNGPSAPLGAMVSPQSQFRPIGAGGAPPPLGGPVGAGGGPAYTNGNPTGQSAMAPAHLIGHSTAQHPKPLPAPEGHHMSAYNTAPAPAMQHHHSPYSSPGGQPIAMTQVAAPSPQQQPMYGSAGHVQPHQQSPVGSAGAYSPHSQNYAPSSPSYSPQHHQPQQQQTFTQLDESKWP
eukprot:TRINITY_DN62150_c0_g1_i1.p1 TRINITY_DN62150_c0_g1~~TRINITY_DN62150_c0_g1_i1.p1  ORF type:complete len:1431 (+),score=196.93 TRINITY_DN62150_c0_g1_i1:53-4345(+)